MTTQSAIGNSNRATLREWIGLSVLALPTPLSSIDMTVLYLALPELSADLALPRRGQDRPRRRRRPQENWAAPWEWPPLAGDQVICRRLLHPGR